MSFISDCIKGRTTTDKLHYYIDMWKEKHQNIALSKYLGMTEREYRLYLTGRISIESVIALHKDKENGGS